MSGKIEWVMHDGLRFHCNLHRAEQNSPWIVFSNSLLTDHTVWDAQVEVLAGRYNILRYDQRGHGQTSVPSVPCTFRQLGSDLIALLDHFAISRATFVGLSMGMPTVFSVFEQQPQRVERLVLSDGLSATAPGGADVWQQRIEAARAGGMKALAAQTAERWFSAEFRKTGNHEGVLAAAKRVSLEGFVACVTALQDYDFTAILPQITVPSLILVGENDGNMPNSMRVICDSITGAQMHIIPDAGHIPCCEKPEIFNQHLLAFLTQSDKNLVLDTSKN